MSRAKLNWPNLLFFFLLPVVAIVGTVLTLVFEPFHWATILFTIVYTWLTGLAITAGYHRLFCHCTYQALWPVRLIFLLFGAAAFQGSALEWSTDHKRHHANLDEEEDPYSIKKGFWHAHIGWIFRIDPKLRDYNNVPNLTSDRLVLWQHKYILPLSIFMGFILPTGIASLWGDPLGGLFITGALRMVLNHHFTFFVNSLAHYVGKKTYNPKISARDNWVVSLVTYGEGFHNFHHQFAADYRNGARWFHFDPSKWMIFLLNKVRLVKNLKRVPRQLILRKKWECKNCE